MNDDGEHSRKYLSPEEAAILSLPKHLRLSSTQKSEEMLSNQMLNGIPEVDLGIDAKIKNIEATEEAKQKLLQDQKNKKDLPSHFVPKNMASNFSQHNRCELNFANFSLIFLLILIFILQLTLSKLNHPRRNSTKKKKIPIIIKDRRRQQMTITLINSRNSLDGIKLIICNFN